MSLVLIAAVLAAMAAFVGVAYARHWSWTGFTAYSTGERPSGERVTKTLWDWLQLLIIPLALAAVGVALNAAQSAREQTREDARAEHDRALAADRAREETLRAYVQQISDLMLQRGLSASRPGGVIGERQAVNAVARGLTLTALRRLDGERKGFVIQFLAEAELVNFRRPKISLAGADLRGAILRDAGFGDVGLQGADLQDADLRAANFTRVDFSFADLRHADLRGAVLGDAPWSIRPARFVSADLRGTDLGDVTALYGNFSLACLTGTRFNGADLEDAFFEHVVGHDVDFARSHLDRATFRGAKLVDVQTEGASVIGTEFPAGWRADGLAIPRTRVSCRLGD